MEKQSDVSRRFIDLKDPKFISTDTELEQLFRERREGYSRAQHSTVEGKDKERISYFISSGRGQTSKSTGVRKKVPSMLLSDRGTAPELLSKSATAKQLPLISARSGSHNKSTSRLVVKGILSSSRQADLNESIEMKEMLNPKRPETDELYVSEFKMNFGNLMTEVNSHVQRREYSRIVKDIVKKRFEKKRELLRKKQDEERIKIYGAKVKVIHEKNNEAITSEEQLIIDRENNLNEMNRELSLNDFYKYENSFFEACFKYPNILLFKTSKPLTNDDEVPELIHYKDLFTNPEKGYLSAFEMPDFHHTSLTNQMSLLKFLPYIVDVEHLVTRFLTSLNEDLRRFEEKFKSNLSRGALLNVVEGYRLELIRLLNNWNLKFLNKVATKFPNEKDIKNILRNYLHTRIDARLLNLRIAKKFFDCYELVKNYEKGYLLLSRAFEDNKKIIDIYLDTYIKYECEKPLMYHFLNNPLDLSFETVKSWEWKSIYFWIDCFDTLHKRNPYVKFLLDDLEQFLSLNQIIEILEVLAEYGFKTSNYYQSEKYYENLLYIYDNVDKMQMIKEHFSTKVDSAEENFGSKTKESIPRSRALRNLELNKKYVKINNEIIKVSNCNCNFEKALSYIANNVFLYYNSLMMINDTDPNKYPKKGGEDIILLDQANYTSSVTTNSNFQNILAFFNWSSRERSSLEKMFGLVSTISSTSSTESFTRLSRTASIPCRSSPSSM